MGGPIGFNFLSCSALRGQRRFYRRRLHLGRQTTTRICLRIINVNRQKSACILNTRAPIRCTIGVIRFPRSALLDTLCNQNRLARSLIHSLTATITSFRRRTRAGSRVHDFKTITRVHRTFSRGCRRALTCINNPRARTRFSRAGTCASEFFRRQTRLFRQQITRSQIHTYRNSLRLGGIYC